MARKPRVHFPGAVYHVICRGNNREPVFERDVDKSSYLALVKEYKEQYGFKLYAWAILSNHVHMLLEVNDVTLSKIMQGIQQTYTGRYNHFNQRTGHVFEQRYRSFLCSSQDQLLATIHYIHHNPARAGLPGGIDNPYCSHRAYLRGTGDKLTDIDVPLNMLSEDRSAAISLYREFMVPNDFYSDQLSAILDTDKAYRKGLGERRPAWADRPLPEVAGVCAQMYGFDAKLMRSGDRGSVLTKARRVLVQFCLTHATASPRELARYLSLSQPAVSQAAVYQCDEVIDGMAKLSSQLIKWPDPN